MKKVLLATIIALAAVSAFAQQTGGTQTAQQASHLDACTPINSQAAGGSQTTLTIPAPPNGQYVYITEVDVQLTVGTALAGVLAPTNITTTNLSGLKWSVTLPVTANTNYFFGPYVWQTAARSASPATAVTIVGPAATGNLTQNINACYWYAP
jgi:hypothetical protein